MNDRRNKVEIRFGLAVLLIALAALAAAGGEENPPSVTASRPFTLSGYTQVQYTTQDSGLDGFAIHRARLVLAGDITSGIHFKIQVDGMKSPMLLDAAVEFAFDEAATVRIGQFKIPFSQEMLTSSGDLDTIDRSQVVSNLSPGLDIGSSGRDIGAVLFGKMSFLEYTVGVFNGAGINKTDTNGQKDFAGRVVLHPASFLSLGVSIYDGSYAPSSDVPSQVRDRFGVEAAFSYDGASVKTEYIQGEDGETLKRGWYVQGGYMFLAKTLQGIFRLDSYNGDTSISMNRTAVWTLGLNWALATRTKLQVNFEWTRDETGRTTNKALLAQFQAGF